MRLKTRQVLLILISLLIASSPSCKRKPPSLEAIDKIDRRSNLPLVEPINRDLAQIRERGSLVVLAPYNSTTYFIYQGEPLGYEYELLRAFAKDLGVTLKMVVVTDPKSLFPLLNSGEGDIAAARLIPPLAPTAALEDQAPVDFTRALYRTEPVLVQQDAAPSSRRRGNGESAGARTSRPFAGD